jgi:HK97 family phage major capsid protein
MKTIEEMKARLSAIVAKLEEYKALEQYDDESVEQINSLSEEFESLKKQIETKEKIEAMSAQASVSVRKVAPAENKVEVGTDRRTLDPKGGFSHAGEFFRAVAGAASGRIDKRLTIQGGHQEKVGEDGGFLIPADFRTEIQRKVTGDESLLSRTRQFQTTSNQLVLPTYEVAPWDGSGIQAYWEGEASQYRESKTKFGDMSMRLHKLTAMVRVTEELLEDAPALESWVRAEAPAAMVNKVNNAIIAGTGAGQPLGVLNSGFKFRVAKETGQPADTVIFENVNKMLGRILPLSLQRAVWIVNPAILPQLRLMKFTDNSPIYLPPTGLDVAPYGTLFGRPLMPMMGAVKAVGDEGDIMLVDLSYYYSAVKTTGVKQDISTHIYFDTAETAFRFSMRIAGQCPFKAPVRTEFGAYDMSAFVTLEDRA